nr:PorV/PorQ family protein [Salinibacter ruber]
MLSIFKAIRVASGTALLLLIVGQVSEAYAQVGLAGAEFQTLQPYPHVHALGNATVAASSSPGAIGVNPATIGESEAARVGGNFNLRRGPVYSSPWFLPETWIAAPSATVKRGDWAAGVQVKHFSRRTLDQRDPQGRRLPDLEQFEQSIKLAVAFDLSSRLTVGGAGNLIRSRVKRRTGNEVKLHPTLDLGVHYATEIEQGTVRLRPGVGFSLTDFGATLSSIGPDDAPAPTTFRAGGALEAASSSSRFGRPEWQVGLYGALSNLLVSGTFRQKDGREYFEADGPFTALFNGWGRTKGGIEGRSGERAEVGPWERLKKHVGIELGVLDALSVRLGRFHESDDNGGRQYTAFGLGVDVYYVSLDASWTLGDDPPLDQVSYGRLTVRIPLSDSPRNFWPALLGGGD